MPAYPSRYRIEERGRRLVTIDTRTGQEYGADLGTGPAPVRSQPIVARTAAPPASTDMAIRPSALSALVATAVAEPAKPGPGAKNNGAVGKLIAIVVGGLMLVVFLVVTNLWLFALIPFAIPQARKLILTWGKATLKKYLDQAATG